MVKAIAAAAAIAACATSADAFAVPGSVRPAVARRGMTMAVSKGSVQELLIKTEELKLLSTASRLGLLSKLERAGLTLRDLEAALPFLDDIDAIALGKELSPDLLAIAPKALEAAPALLPLAAAALDIPPSALLTGAALSVVAGLAAIAAIPDDSIGAIALQAFLAVPLLVLAPGAAVVGAGVLTKANDGTLVPFAKEIAGKAGIVEGLKGKAAAAVAAPKAAVKAAAPKAAP
ncbi:hypothetical protein JKP88DRAFT_348853, partial [Tribonema minus]